MAYSLLPANIYAGEVPLLSTQMVMDFDSDIGYILLGES